jgi:Lon protease-like protein
VALLLGCALSERRQAHQRRPALRRQDDGLNIGDIEILENEPRLPLPEEYQGIAAILAGVLNDLGRLYASLDRQFDDTGWVTSRFVEILPIELAEKQRCLEQSDPLERLRIVRRILDAT